MEKLADTENVLTHHAEEEETVKPIWSNWQTQNNGSTDHVEEVEDHICKKLRIDSVCNRRA
jgi:hypothetical protein